MNFDPIDRFFSESVSVNESEFALNLDYDTSDIFEEGVIDKIKNFFSVGTRRSRDLEQAIYELQAKYASDGATYSKTWPTILKVLSVLNKISVVSSTISLTANTIIELLSMNTAVAAYTAVGAVAEAEMAASIIGSISIVSIPLMLVYGLMIAFIYYIINKLINKGLEDDAVNKAASIMGYLRGIRDNVAKRDPRQARQLDADIEKVQNMIRNPYTESSFEFEDANPYSGERGVKMQRYMNNSYIRLIRCMHAANNVIKAMDKSTDYNERLLAMVDNVLKEFKGLIIAIWSTVGVSALATAFIAAEICIPVAFTILIASCVATMVLAFVTWNRSSVFEANIKSMAYDMCNTINSLTVKAKNPVVRNSLINAKQQIEGTLNGIEVDPQVQYNYNIN